MRPRDTALVLAGGNALGAFHAGAYEGFRDGGVLPDRIVGASIGAVTAAIIAGNPPESQVPQLRRFWDEMTQHTGPDPVGALKPRQYYNGLHALLTLAQGRPSLFQHRFPGLWSALPWMPNDVALFDHSPLLGTLDRLVDFERLNSGPIRVTIGCVDLETGDEVYFDNAHETIRPEHILASTAILPAFAPVEVDGRMLCDIGYTNNLPLDPLFVDEPERDLLCFALDLFALAAPRPASLDAVLERANDLIFASAGRRAIASLEREYRLRETIQPDGPSVLLMHLPYRAGADQLAAKSFDFSPSSIRDRWQAGYDAMVRATQRVSAHRPDGRRFMLETA